MLYNLNWLREGEVFPPICERERLKTYSDNRALFKGDVEKVLPSYRQRIRNILNKFIDVPINDFKSDLNYWQLVTLKTGDMVCGEPPTITISSNEDSLKQIRQESKFDSKLLKAVYDVSRFGECIVRVKKKVNGKNNFTVHRPDLWFPIVSIEDLDDIICHALAWTEDVSQGGKEKKYNLRVQEHYKGYYIARTFDVEEYKLSQTTVLGSGLNVEMPTFKLGRELIQEKKKVETGLDDFAIVPFQNVTLSDSVYAAVNDYDRITAILAELEVRYALENTVLDKHSAPTIHAPLKSLNMDQETGEWKFPAGGIVPTEKEEVPPGYMTWDGSLENNHAMIDKLEKHLYSLSEMGAIVNDEAFGASQGFEALETRMTNARLKSRRLSSGLIGSVKKLFDLLSQIGYERIYEEDISVCFNDGLPNNEFREADIALKKQPFFSTKTLLQEHFSKTEEDAEKEVKGKQKELQDSMGGGFAVGLGGGDNGEQTEEE